MSHAPFVYGAYAVALIAFGALVLVSILARRKVRRELSQRGLDRRR